jgi:pimeloyl-ACP methyl ester carboxylesterase
MPLMTFRHPITGVTREVKAYLPRHFKALLLMNDRRFEIPVLIGLSGGGGAGASERFAEVCGFDRTFYQCHQTGSSNWLDESSPVYALEGLRIADEVAALPQAVVGLFPQGLHPGGAEAAGWSNGVASFDNLPWDSQDTAWLIPMVESMDAGLRAMLSPAFLDSLATARGVTPSEVRVLDFSRIFLLGYSVGACMAFKAAYKLRGQICGFAAVNGSIGGFQNMFEEAFVPDAKVLNGPTRRLQRGKKVHALIANALGDNQYRFEGGMSLDNRDELEAPPGADPNRVYGFPPDVGKQYARYDLSHAEAVDAWLLGNDLSSMDFTASVIGRAPVVDEAGEEVDLGPYEINDFPAGSGDSDVVYPETVYSPSGWTAAPAWFDGPTVREVSYAGGHDWPGEDLWLEVIWPWMRTRSPRD